MESWEMGLDYGVERNNPQPKPRKKKKSKSKSKNKNKAQRTMPADATATTKTPQHIFFDSDGEVIPDKEAGATKNELSSPSMSSSTSLDCENVNIGKDHGETGGLEDSLSEVKNIQEPQNTIDLRVNLRPENRRKSNSSISSASDYEVKQKLKK